MGERFLITCADERSWNTERPVLFLGEWCRRIDREQAWQGLDAVVARPVRFDAPERERVIASVDKLSRELLPELAQLLNRLHGVRRSQRYWRILLGHWLFRYTSLLSHRWHAVQQVLDEHQLSGTIVFTGPAAQLARHDTVGLSWASIDDVWNNVLIGRVLQESARIPIEYRELREPRPAAAGSGAASSSAPPRSVALLIDRALGIFQRPTSSFVISSYLPPWQSMLLSMRLGDVPRLRRSPPVQPAAVDDGLRAANRLDPGAERGLPAFARQMLLEMLPTCYLEGFAALHRQVAQQAWPSRPRLIFTSSGFDTSEVFKLWTAARVEEGRPYIIGQHGNNYGTARYCPSETECVEIGDAFLTWGWQDQKRRCKPAFIFKTAGRPRGTWKPHGGALLIEDSLPHLTSPWDPYPEFAAYFHDQFEFVASLPEAVQRAITVRLHASCPKLPWCDQERWRRRLPQITLDDGLTPIATLMRASRLIVHSYDSTGILETLSLNLPTVCFWRGGLAHLRDSAIPFYELLQAAGILHQTPQDAARQVADVWQDVGAWWGSRAVQAARRKFIAQYAKASARPVRSLKRLLLEASSVAAAG